MPPLLPSALKQAHAAIEEMAFLVAMETIDSDPRRPLVIQISAPPHRWFDTDVPGGRWGIDNPDLDNKPANGRANHIPLTAGGDTLFIRNTLADWASEDLDYIEVKRVAGPGPAPTPSDDELADRIVSRLHKVIGHVIGHLQAPIYRLPVNVLTAG